MFGIGLILQAVGRYTKRQAWWFAFTTRRQHCSILESTGDCPIPKERLSGVRVTSLTGKDGSTQTIQDSWEDGQDKEFQNRIDREDCVHSDLRGSQNINNQDNKQFHFWQKDWQMYQSVTREKLQESSSTNSRRQTGSKKVSTNRVLEEWQKWMRFVGSSTDRG